MTGSPSPLFWQTPPKPFHTDSMLIGPSTELPVLLSKTSRPVFTICTYCVEPTAPFVSGGAQLQLTPGKSIPSKLSCVPGIFGAATLV